MTEARNKYNARKAFVNGIKFDSVLEAEVYLHLFAASKKLGFELTLQPEFELIPAASPYPGRHLRAHTYTADFKIAAEGLEPAIVIDVKGASTKKNRDFSINEKLMWVMRGLCVTVIEDIRGAENLIEMLEGALCRY